MTQHDPAEAPSSIAEPTIGQEIKSGVKETAREVGRFVLHLVAGSLLALIGLALAIAGLITGSKLMLYAGIAMLVVGVFWVMVVWNINGSLWS